jgi:hypothetical protein
MAIVRVIVDTIDTVRNLKQLRTVNV